MFWKNAFSERRQFVSREMEIVQRNSGILSFRNNKTPVDPKKIKTIKHLGAGAFGEVTKMLYDGKRTKVVMAVKRMKLGKDDVMYRTMMDLHVIGKSVDCPQIVKFYGYILNENKTDVQLCMEYMDHCLRSLVEIGIPEDIIQCITLNVVKALNYLKKVHNIIHRDVKPDNILLDRRGNIKLCDFGVSGYLQDSVICSNQGGSLFYMPPERLGLNPVPYGVENDVWSLGITLVEVANGKHPYSGYGRFEAMARIEEDDAPRISEEDGFSPEFCNFVAQCLQREPSLRAKYLPLLQHNFLQHCDTQSAITKVQEWINDVLEIRTDEF